MFQPFTISLLLGRLEEVGYNSRICEFTQCYVIEKVLSGPNVEVVVEV